MGNKKKLKSNRYFFLFILPAFLLYFIFFLLPFFQGVFYSFTDWNGITPQIPLQFTQYDFEEKVIGKIKNEKDKTVIKKYYQQKNDRYILNEWYIKDGKSKKIDSFQIGKIRAILSKTGIRSINFIGFDNYRDIFTKDRRFMPSIEKRFLYDKKDDLPLRVEKSIFEKKLLKNLHRVEKDFLLSKYKLKSLFTLKDVRNRDMINKVLKSKGIEESYYVNESIFYEYLNKSEYKNLFTKSEMYVLEEGLEEGLSDYDIRVLKETLLNHFFEYKLINGAVGFTLFFTFFNVILTNLIALLLALALDSKIRSKNILRSLFFMPNVLSLVIVAFIWSFLFKMAAKIPLLNIGWLGDASIAPFSVIIVQVWQGAGYVMLIYLAGLQSIPSDILEVAEIDGATYLDKFLKIVIPLLLPSFTISLFITITNSLRCFDIIWVLTNGGPGYATTPIVVDIYNNAFAQNRFGYGTAKAILLCLIIIGITTIQLSVMKKKEVEY